MMPSHMPHQRLAHFLLQDSKPTSRATLVVIGAGTSTSSTASLVTDSSTGAEADTEETTASEAETDKKDDKWVSVPTESTPPQTIPIAS
jgi:hypothetical protein